MNLLSDPKHYGYASAEEKNNRKQIHAMITSMKRSRGARWRKEKLGLDPFAIDPTAPPTDPPT